MSPTQENQQVVEKLRRATDDVERLQATAQKVANAEMEVDAAMQRSKLLESEITGLQAQAEDAQKRQKAKEREAEVYFQSQVKRVKFRNCDRG